MQLLDSEQLEFAFQLHGITLEAQARRFYADLWQTIQDAEKAADGPSMAAHERHLRHLCQSYFALVRSWQQEEEERHEALPASSASRDNAREALGALAGFEKQFFRYALCYMELNRALIRSRGKIQYFAKDYNLDDNSNALEVNHGTGALLDRVYQEAVELLQKRRRLEYMKQLLQASDPFMEEIGRELPRTMHAEGDHQLTIFKGALRRGEYERALQIAGAWKNKTLCATGQMVVAMIRQNESFLKVHEGIVLHSGELSLIFSSLKGEEKKSHDFLSKYNIPYMVFQYRTLLHLGYLLGKIGSIEGLIIQHAKLTSLAARPQHDADYAKMQQQTILIPVRALLETKFPTLGAIFNEMETTLHTLDRMALQTRDYLVGQSA